jgi:hypothetical protein
MASRFKNQIFFVLLLTAFLGSLVPSAQAHAKEPLNNIPNFSSFVQSVQDGNADNLRGVYVAGKMAFPISQQPMGNPGFVSTTASTVTQFNMASEVGNLGLLAHNYLAGANFSTLAQGDTIFLIYGDGHTQSFVVEEILQYQATSPLSPYSDFQNLASEEFLTAESLFNKVYRGDFHLTLQTCIEKDGELSWGRLFIIAKPSPIKSYNTLSQHMLEF